MSETRKLLSTRGVIVAATFVVSIEAHMRPATGAEFGMQLNGYIEMHTKSDYGSLLFRDETVDQRFILINGDGELRLPVQSRYCFVLNHYSQQKGFQNVLRTYRAKTTKWYSETESSTELFRNRYIPTADETSEAITDYCIKGVAGVVKIEIEFGSDDGSSFRHKIFFRLS